MVARHPRLELAVDLPEVLEISVLPDARSQPGQKGGAERGRLGLAWPPHRDAEQIGLELAQNVHDGRTAIDPKLTKRLVRVALHRLDHVARLVSHCFHRCAHQLRASAAARQPDDRPPRVWVPMWSPEADEGRDQEDSTTVRHGGRQRPSLGGALDDAQTVAKPLQRGAGDEDGALERVAQPAGSPPRHRGEHPRIRRHTLVARLHEHERTRAIGVLGHPDGGAGLAEQGRLLIAGDAADRCLNATERRRVAARDLTAGIAHLGKIRERHAEQRRHLGAPHAAPDIEQQGARRVGSVGHVVAPSRKARHEPAVDGSDGGIGYAVHVLHDPGELGRGEVGIEHEPGDLTHTILVPCFAQPRALGRCAPVLPHDGAGQWLERPPIPDDQGFTLVRDSDGAHVARPRAGCLNRIASGPLNRGPYLLGVVFDPAGLRIVLFDLRVALPTDVAVHADGDGRGAGRALIEAEDDSALSHARSLLPAGFPNSVQAARGVALEVDRDELVAGLT